MMLTPITLWLHHCLFEQSVKCVHINHILQSLCNWNVNQCFQNVDYSMNVHTYLISNRLSCSSLSYYKCTCAIRILRTTLCNSWFMQTTKSRFVSRCIGTTGLYCSRQPIILSISCMCSQTYTSIIFHISIQYNHTPTTCLCTSMFCQKSTWSVY